MSNELITQFLSARIVEDEKAAEQASAHTLGGDFANDNYGWLLVRPDRILAECEAKRAIIEECDEILNSGDWDYQDAPNLARRILRALAITYHRKE